MTTIPTEKRTEPDGLARPLRRELALALLFKVMALVALWAFFFGPSHRIRPTPTDMSAHLFGAENARLLSADKK